jgi:hypothetical protein
MSVEKKRNIPAIKKVNIHQPDEFQYDKLVGSGAFGKVRICLHNNSDGGSTGSSDGTAEKKPAVKMGKQLDKRSMNLQDPTSLQSRRAIKPNDQNFAVKIQSKYQLIKGK